MAGAGEQDIPGPKNRAGSETETGGDAAINQKVQKETGDAPPATPPTEVTDSGAKNLGAIVSMDTPADFKLTTKVDTALGYTYSWTPPGRKDVSLSVSSRAQNLNAEDTKALSDILAKPDGYVLNPQEIQSLQGLLRDKADPSRFTTSLVYVREIEGKKVLSLAGEFDKEKIHNETLYIPVNKAGSAIQEVAYQAPISVNRWGDAAGKSMDSIKLKN